MNAYFTAFPFENAAAFFNMSEMNDELGARRIPVVRYSQADMDEELAYVAELTRR